MRTYVALATILILLLTGLHAQGQQQENTSFSFNDDGTSLTLLENGRPVLSYIYGRKNPPEGMDVKYWRSNYVHPIYGLDGEMLTEDFPDDHPHHRGLHWAWPVVTWGEREVDPWALVGARQLFINWTGREAASDHATFSFEGGWRLVEGWEPFVREQISITVHRSDEVGQAIDFDLRFENMSDKPVTVRGRGTKGYGGFNIRPDGGRPGIRITTAQGETEEDLLQVQSGWADFTSQISANGKEAGIALFQHPGNPGFPHHGWILRHYGFLGAAWPHTERVKIEPGENIQLSYRVYVHRGDAEEGQVRQRFREFVEAEKNARSR